VDVPSFLIQPLPADHPLNRHVFRDRFEYDVKFDGRLPVEHGGAGSSSLDPKPVVPVASWLLARSARLIAGGFRQAMSFNEDNEAVIHLVGERKEEILGPVNLTFTPSGEVRALFQAEDVVKVEALHMGLRDALLASPSELDSTSIEFPGGERFGWEDGSYHGRITREFNPAELVDNIRGGEPVQKLPDDRVENCPVAIDRIAGQLSEPRKPVTAKRVRYLQSAVHGDIKAWVFKVSRRELYAVVVWRRNEQPEVEFVG
jgi:hypothetical protein